LDGKGVLLSEAYTSHMTSTLSPPRIGSGHTQHGRRTTSESFPGAWSVEEPS
jgi:hypothetical protein